MDPMYGIEGLFFVEKKNGFLLQGLPHSKSLDLSR